MPQDGFCLHLLSSKAKPSDLDGLKMQSLASELGIVQIDGLQMKLVLIGFKIILFRLLLY
jgi:hypothetical protein